jgi:hypothetical protein
MPEPGKLDKVADTLEDINKIVGQFIPLVGPFMGLLGTVLKLVDKPNMDPALRRQAIETMHANFTTVGLNADAWLASHGYDKNGNKVGG